MEAGQGSSEEYLGTKKKSSPRGLMASLEPSQVDLGTFSELPQVHFDVKKAPFQSGLVAFSMPVQTSVEVRPQAGLIGYCKSFQADLESQPTPFQSDFSICPRPPMDQGQAQGPSPQAPDDSLRATSKLVTGAKSPKQLNLQESPEKAQSWASVGLGSEESQTPTSQANSPLMQTQEPLPGSEIKRKLVLTQKSQEAPTWISSVRQFFQRQKGKEAKLSSSKKDQQHYQFLERIPMESTSPSNLRRIAREQLLSRRGHWSPEAQLSRREEPSNLHLINKGAIVNVMSSTETGLIKEGRDLYVCDKFLMSNCQRGRDCPGYHTVLPFHWQFLHKEDNAWHSIPLGSQLHLEMLFTNPRRTMVIISYAPGKKVFFQMSTKYFPKIAPFITARRITCQENSLFPPSFVFYWSVDEEEWIPYEEQVQHLIQTSKKRVLKLLSQPDNEEVTLDLNNSVQVKGNSIQLVTCRAKYTPFHQLVTKFRFWHREQSSDLSILGEEATDTYFGPYPAKNIVTLQEGKENYTLMEMLPSDIAYQNCCERFYSSFDPQEAVVLRVFRLYNPMLWEQYNRQKMKMLEFINKTDSTRLEYHLFHQTTLKMEEVAVNGLDPKLSVVLGTLGLGMYFSLHAQTTAMMNAEQAPTFGHVMVLAKVLVGRKALGRPSLMSPPVNSDGQPCDCCVNDLYNPTLFTVFKKQYSYPYFIILYKLCRDTINLSF